MNTLFFGTPAVAVPFLERLSRLSRVVGVVTAPDKPAGRGHALTPPPVKTAAEKLGLPVFQPERLGDPSVGETCAAWGPVDLGLVVAYGKIIPPALFNRPRLGLVNVHFSLLPKYRGAGPVQRALMNGETETGVTLFRIEEGLDTGPVYLQARAPIRPDDTATSLRGRLVDLSLPLLDELLEKTPAPKPQEGTPTAAPLLKKEDGRLRWDRLTAEEASNVVRGTFEWPGAFTVHEGRTVKIRDASPRPGVGGAAGAVLGLDGGALLVQCRSGVLAVRRLQPEGKREMSADDFWNGFRLKPGDRFA